MITKKFFLVKSARKYMCIIEMNEYKSHNTSHKAHATYNLYTVVQCVQELEPLRPAVVCQLEDQEQEDPRHKEDACHQSRTNGDADQLSLGGEILRGD